MFISANTAKAESADARMMVHLLDYISVDYSMAVKANTIINVDEFGEMQEFASSVEKLAKREPSNIQEKIQSLKSLIDSKASVDQVAKLAQSIKSELIDFHKLSVSPKKWPSLKNAKALYIKNCQSCHGVEGRGDGALAVGLNPSPTNFHDEDKANGLSPFQAYNTIKLGVSNTGMRAFTELNEDEAWDLAFYTISLSRKQNKNALIEKFKASEKVDLELLATRNNTDLEKILGQNENLESIISGLRLKPEQTTKLASVDYIQLAQSNIIASNIAYAQGDKSKARALALSAYLDGVEPIEMQLRANDANFVSELEGQLTKMRAAIEAERDVQIVEKLSIESQAVLATAQEILDNQTFSSWLTFTLSSTIILREGLEAFLVIITILGIIRSLKLPKASKYIHIGWMAAIASGFLMWWGAGHLFSFSGAQREIMEGLIALFAVAILVYVGFWMHSKSEASKWQAFVKNKIQKITSRESLIGLAFLSFVVVFREAFESVLFLSALSSEAGSEHSAAFVSGILVAFVILIVLSVLLLKYSKKLPIPQLFKYSSYIMALLAVVLVGKGVHALQEAGKIGVSNTPFNFRVDLLGLYPTWQSLVSQILILVLLFVLWNIGNRPVVQKVKA